MTLSLNIAGMPAGILVTGRVVPHRVTDSVCCAGAEYKREREIRSTRACRCVMSIRTVGRAIQVNDGGSDIYGPPSNLPPESGLCVMPEEINRGDAEEWTWCRVPPGELSVSHRNPRF